MTLSNSKKCCGCGAKLTLQKNSIGYAPNLKFNYCERCFKLIHYGKCDNEYDFDSYSQDNLKKIDVKNNIIFLVVDILDIPGTLISEFKLNKINIIINKVDLLPNKINHQMLKTNILNLLKKHDFIINKLFILSVKNKTGIKSINEIINKTNWNKKIYFVGKTNVGKSSLINALISLNNFNNKFLTTSKFENTTLNFNKIKIGKHQIIDCPGFNFHDSINTNLKLLNKIKPINFQVKRNCNFNLDKLFELSLTNSQIGNITFYSQLSIQIQKRKFNELKKSIDKKILNFKCKKDIKYNLNISGYGLISIKNIDTIEITIPKNINVNLIEGGII